MPRITSSALRPLRLNGLRALQSSPQTQAARAATTYTTPPNPKPTAPARPAQSLYKRSATTTSPSSSSSAPPYKPASSTSPSPSTPSTPSSSSSSSSTTTIPNNNTSNASPASKAPTSAYAAQQLDPLPPTPYRPPPNAPPLPDAPQSDSNGNGNGNGNGSIDWSSSFHGLSTVPFAPEIAQILMAPLPFDDVEIKPDGIIYLPEIKYRRILNTAFGPGGWGMAPRGDLAVGEKVVTREYALLVHGRFIAQARGECGFFGGDDGIATAGEGCKSNALMRCCKDLGIASELWDPRYIREFKKKYASEIWVEHVGTKKKRIITLRKGDEPSYPYKKS